MKNTIIATSLILSSLAFSSNARVDFINEIKYSDLKLDYNGGPILEHLEEIKEAEERFQEEIQKDSEDEERRQQDLYDFKMFKRHLKGLIDEKNLETGHRVVAKINDYGKVYDFELKTTGSTNDLGKYEFAKNSTAFFKVTKDNLSGSIKYEFDDERIILNGGYRYDNNKLVVDPNLELSLEKFKPTKLRFANELDYQFTDKFTVKTNFDVYKSLYKLIDKITVPEFILRDEIKSNKTSVFGGSAKFGLEYKVTDKFKLMANAYGVYDDRKGLVFENNKHIIEEEQEELQENQLNQESLMLNQNKKAYSFDIKAQYGDKSKFYTDLTLKYDYSNIYRDINIGEVGPVLINKKNMYEIDSNLMYTFNMTNRFSLTPGINLNYKYNLDSYELSSLNDLATKITFNSKDSKLTVNPSIKFEYKWDSVVIGVGVQVPIEIMKVKYSEDFIDGFEMLDNSSGLVIEQYSAGIKKVRKSPKLTLSISHIW